MRSRGGGRAGEEAGGGGENGEGEGGGGEEVTGEEAVRGREGGRAEERRRGEGGQWRGGDAQEGKWPPLRELTFTAWVSTGESGQSDTSHSQRANLGQALTKRGIRTLPTSILPDSSLPKDKIPPGSGAESGSS